MSRELLSVEDTATYLKLHPKTVLRFIREGRLPATKVGRAYRISRSDINSLAGRPEEEPETPFARVTSIVDIANVSLDEGQRIVSSLQAALNGPARHDIQLQTAHDVEQHLLKLIIIGAPDNAGALLSLLSKFSKDGSGQP
ncbi:MAG: helix-turn-helix domain-containing protein [Hyphomicrobiaceae bacterium]|nr:helix-turn-helix domain-containing protein [Hyphomicrobiaceae bacterium]MCC0023222.1 helix-turn-helix domain-containing protein [Hyphomicrobiaceae bacterium]